MSPVSHQTIKLTPGKHYSPDDGACVMELASMLAGESFNDHPVSVCPVIASLLRSYNDAADDNARQDLYGYAAKVVGSRGSAEVDRRRGAYVAAWTYERRLARLRRFLPAFAARRLCELRTLSLESIGTQAVRQIPKHTDETHRAMLALVETLLAIRDRAQTARADADTLVPVGPS
jgi:hypothetical protein